MAIRIIEGTDYAVLYCSTSMWAFGPVFEDADQAREFLEFVPGDPRLLSDTTLEGYYSQFLAREKEEEPPKADAYGDYLNKFDGWLGGFRDSFSAPKKP